MDLRLTAEQFRGWMPISFGWRDAEPRVGWILADDCRFTEPFYDQTVESLLKRPFNQLFRQFTAVDALSACSTHLETLKPRGFIFHLSRCGSTLVARMLSSLPQNVVISEASSLDKVIRANIRWPDLTEDEHTKWIRWMIGSLAQKRTGDAEHFFVKFDTWHTFYLDLIELAFPDVPWIFLYRQPAEILVSHIEQRGAMTIPGIVEHPVAGLSVDESLTMPKEEYAARGLAEVCRAALRKSASPNAYFINYARLPDAVTAEMLQHFSLSYTDTDTATMNSATRFHSKDTSSEFTSDTAEKQRKVSDAIRVATDTFMMPMYNELEAAAKVQRPGIAR